MSLSLPHDVKQCHQCLFVTANGRVCLVSLSKQPPATPDTLETLVFLLVSMEQLAFEKHHLPPLLSIPLANETLSWQQIRAGKGGMLIG